MVKFQWLVIGIAIVLALLSTSSCNDDQVTVAGKGRKGKSGLKPGINYMQPLRWRMTYNYRVQDITPKVKYISPRAMPGFKGINAVGQGNYEVWFTGPRAGEGVRDVKLIEAIPPPTAVSEGSGTEPVYYYYNFSPGGQLPDQVSATLTWEFTTFERYTFWDGMEVGDYDKESELYKLYTKEEAPIDFEVDMVKVAQQIQQDAKGDPMKTAMGCYNYILANFRYDFSQENDFVYEGQVAMVNASRSWQNKHGICDEFASVFCAMTRSVGIPSRPVIGFSHGSLLKTGEGMDGDLMKLFKKVERKHGPYLKVGGHGWAEYYLPNIGWVPLDPTWGDGTEDLIAPYYSRIGANRNIRVGEYYYGKMDPLRIALYKDWNYNLDPAPISPGANPVQGWMLGCAERSSGVQEMIHGWEGVKSKDPYGGSGFYRSATFAGENYHFTIEALGPDKSDQVASTIEAIRGEGHHYLKVPEIKANWPMVTCGTGYNETMMEMAENIAKEFRGDQDTWDLLEQELLQHFGVEELEPGEN